jgi:hypothetical protein
MTIRPLNLILLSDKFAFAKLPSDAPIPSWATSGSFFSITGSPDELSIVCLQALLPQGIEHEPGWRCIRVAGTMDFSVIGVLASLVGPLAEAGISVFAISTFDTDYLLVKEAVLEEATAILQQAGHSIQATPTGNLYLS